MRAISASLLLIASVAAQTYDCICNHARDDAGFGQDCCQGGVIFQSDQVYTGTWYSATGCRYSSNSWPVTIEQTTDAFATCCSYAGYPHAIASAACELIAGGGK